MSTSWADAYTPSQLEAHEGDVARRNRLFRGDDQKRKSDEIRRLLNDAAEKARAAKEDELKKASMEARVQAAMKALAVNAAPAAFEGITGSSGMEKPSRIPKVSDVIRASLSYFGLTMAEFLSARRQRQLVRQRQVAMYVARTLTTSSYPEIGRRFGGRDHTTVIHGVAKVEHLIASGDDDIIEAAATIMVMVEGVRP